MINQPKCSVCHGSDHVVRGVIQISSSVNDVYKKTRNNIIISGVLYSIVVFILAVIIILFLQRFIIKRIFTVGRIVHGVGEGDFITKIDVDSKDEIGTLSEQINYMIDGLHERFKLTKFVSKSTLEHVKGSDEITIGGEKKEMNLILLF